MTLDEWDDITEPRFSNSSFPTEVPPPPPTERDLEPLTEPVDAPDALPVLPEIPNDRSRDKLPWRHNY